MVGYFFVLVYLLLQTPLGGTSLKNPNFQCFRRKVTRSCNSVQEILVWFEWFRIHKSRTPDKWGQRSVEYALLTHKTTGKKIDHFNTHFCVCTDTISDCCGQEGQYQSAKEVQAAMDLHRRPGLFVLARLETLKSSGT